MATADQTRTSPTWPHWPIITLPPDLADFLASKITLRAFDETQDEVEFAEPWDQGQFRNIKDRMDREWATVSDLVEKRQVELTRPLLAFAGEVLGSSEGLALDGREDDDESIPLARALFEALRDAASQMDLKEVTV